MAGRRQRAAAWLWLLVAAVACFEIGADAWIRNAVPTEESWDRASDFVRERFGPHDRVVAAPAWADPIVRFHLGDLLTLRAAAPSDLAGFERLWELSIRGASTRDDPPALEREIDGIRVRMWELDTAPIVYDFVEQITQGEVSLVERGAARSCPWVEEPAGSGGLGRGPMPPEERFVCDPRRPWLWVGATVMADLSLRPRRCVWQHPAGPDPVRVTFSDVPLGEALVVHGGLDYEHERWRAGAPVVLRVWIDDRLAGEMVHRDGDGWSALSIDTRAIGLDRASVRFETSATDATARLFCWSASTRQKEAGHE